MTIKDLLIKGTAILKNGGFSSPKLDAEVLLAFVLDKDRTYFFMYPQEEVSMQQLLAFRSAVESRLSGIPVAYITGHQEFMSLDFFVNPSTLIPRPDTELLVETAMQMAEPHFHILDMCTGSGAIGISLAYYLKTATVMGVDISPDALSAAKKNALRHQVDSRIQFLEGDLFTPLKKELFHMIVSNPPYIQRDVIPTLSKEVSVFEPRIALDGGHDGLDFYREIIKTAPDFFHPKGILLLEIGYDQGDQVSELLQSSGQFTQISILKDLAGWNRLICARFF